MLHIQTSPKSPHVARSGSTSTIVGGTRRTWRLRPTGGSGSFRSSSSSGAIAVLPLTKLTEHWWESNLSRYLVAAALVGLATMAYYWITHGSVDPSAGVLDHSILLEYIPFIVLLFSLYVISGGIQLVGDMPGHAAGRTSLLHRGRRTDRKLRWNDRCQHAPDPPSSCKTNRQRKHKVHTIVMFIFLVSNIGGSLLPIGDPPLFLGLPQRGAVLLDLLALAVRGSSPVLRAAAGDLLGLGRGDVSPRIGSRHGL